MTNIYPRMLFKVGGPHEIHGGRFDYVIVTDEDAEEKALASGWFLTTGEACEKKDSLVADDAPPTRAELERKATELNIKFDGRTTDTKLAEKIEAALKD